jgi:hypothetical protein
MARTSENFESDWRLYCFRGSISTALKDFRTLITSSVANRNKLLLFSFQMRASLKYVRDTRQA